MGVTTNSFASTFGSSNVGNTRSGMLSQVSSTRPAGNSNGRRWVEDEAFIKAEYWLNIGYVTTATFDTGDALVEEERFISLPKGIPLDQQGELPTGGEGIFAQTQAARSDLNQDFLAMAMKLEPGETMLLPGEIGGLRMQLRRKKGEAAPVKSEENPLRKRLALFDAAA